MNKQTREVVYKKYDGRCAYCGRPIAMKDMQVDHITPKHRGGIDDIDNYNPSCRMCNFRKGTLTVDEFRGEIVKQKERLEKLFAYRMSCAYGLISPGSTSRVIFFFERLKKRAARHPRLRR